ncbi:hypothetical protein D047_3330A, partial [Vibrio parahaemolyticus VPTS-2010_2]
MGCYQSLSPNTQGQVLGRLRDR